MKVKWISPRHCHVESGTLPGKWYNIDVIDQTCDCPDYVNRRAELCEICKHIREANDHPERPTMLPSEEIDTTLISELATKKFKDNEEKIKDLEEENEKLQKLIDKYGD